MPKSVCSANTLPVPSGCTRFDRKITNVSEKGSIQIDVPVKPVWPNASADIRLPHDEVGRIHPRPPEDELHTDPHPVARFRANATLMNMPEFHKAFQCKLGDAMVRPPAERPNLW